MTATQWAFVAGLFGIAAALGVVVAVSWKYRNPSTLIGVAFAVIAVISTVNLTLVAHKVRVTSEETEARFEARLNCTQAIVEALEARDRALDAGTDPRLIVLPKC